MVGPYLDRKTTLCECVCVDMCLYVGVYLCVWTYVCVWVCVWVCVKTEEARLGLHADKTDSVEGEISDD